MGGAEKGKVRKARSPSNHDLAIEVVPVPAGAKVLGSLLTQLSLVPSRSTPSQTNKNHVKHGQLH